jgi:Zn-finger nucleic acid-binding protein
MKCPVDQATLVMAQRNGVEIDYCPTCRGVWLDRGELDKILERSAAEAGPAVPLREPPREERRDERRDDRREERRFRDDDDDDYRRDGRPRRRESFLSDLFDF